MLLVVGLGNPGRRYELNRHNVGFMAVDRLRSDLGFPDFKEKFNGLWCKGDAWARPVAVLKPQTFMNRSGDSVHPAAQFLKVPPAQIIVVHDELDLPWCDVRLKQGGGHAGNNGVRHILERLGTPDFIRLRVGIGRPPPGFRGEVADYVLQDLGPAERADLPDVLTAIVGAIERVVVDGIAAAMGVVNQRKLPKAAASRPPKPEDS